MRRKGAGEKIFISYRRSDTEGYAGRLSDSLTTYFGPGRVFRDVGSIEPGQDFIERIGDTIRSARAVLVMIGPDWLAAGDGERPRLFDSDDHLAAEIQAALENKLVVIPVLVQGAQMPREEELPPKLKLLTRRNAVSLTDEGWKADTTRLANILALDVSGSVAEKKLAALRIWVLLLLAGPMIFSFIAFSGVFDLGSLTEPTRQTLALVNALAIFTVFLLLTARATWFHASRVRYVWATVATGIAPGVATFVYYYLFNDSATAEHERFVFTVTSIMMTLMLALICLSGFKASDQLH